MPRTWPNVHLNRKALWKLVNTILSIRLFSTGPFCFIIMRLTGGVEPRVYVQCMYYAFLPPTILTTWVLIWKWLFSKIGVFIILFARWHSCNSTKAPEEGSHVRLNKKTKTKNQEKLQFPCTFANTAINMAYLFLRLLLKWITELRVSRENINYISHCGKLHEAVRSGNRLIKCPLLKLRIQVVAVEARCLAVPAAAATLYRWRSRWTVRHPSRTCSRGKVPTRLPPVSEPRRAPLVDGAPAPPPARRAVRGCPRRMVSVSTPPSWASRSALSSPSTCGFPSGWASVPARTRPGGASGLWWNW